MAELGCEQTTREKINLWPEANSPRLPEKETLNLDHWFGVLMDNLQNKQPIGEIEKAIFFDLKTGLLDRKFFFMFMKSALLQNENLGLAVFDLDNLKAYNTYFGEPSGGDIPIKKLAGALEEAGKGVGSEGGIFACRIDGDTFAVIFSSNRINDGTADKYIKDAENLFGTPLDLGQPTAKYEVLPEGQRLTLREYLSVPHVTYSMIRELSPTDLEDIDGTLKKIIGKIPEQKAAKRPEAIKKLTRRLG